MIELAIVAVGAIGAAWALRHTFADARRDERSAGEPYPTGPVPGAPPEKPSRKDA